MKIKYRTFRFGRVASERLELANRLIEEHRKQGKIGASLRGWLRKENEK